MDAEYVITSHHNKSHQRTKNSNNFYESPIRTQEIMFQYSIISFELLSEDLNAFHKKFD